MGAKRKQTWVIGKDVPTIPILDVGNPIPRLSPSPTQTVGPIGTDRARKSKADTVMACCWLARDSSYVQIPLGTVLCNRNCMVTGVWGGISHPLPKSKAFSLAAVMLSHR